MRLRGSLWLAAAVLSLLVVSLPAQADRVADKTVKKLDHEDEIVVTASRVPAELASITRSVIVIDREQIVSALVHDLAGLLDYIAGVDVVQRGPGGVQADLSIRGATFEQTQILIDGIKVGDPQTGHHSLDLPLSLDDIERIEVLRGPAARLYGPNAFGGVINLITRRAGKHEAGLDFRVGGFGRQDVGVSLAAPLGRTRHRMSVERRRSSGYRSNTDFDLRSAFYAATVPIGRSTLEATLGYSDKRFGANGFYSDRFPGQWERTSTSYAAVSMHFEGDGLPLAATVSWRRHGDEFLLDRERPEFYRNTHTTDVYAVELAARVRSHAGVTAVALDLGREQIVSSSLGNHARQRLGILVEHLIVLPERWQVSAGAALYRCSDNGWQFWPGLDAGWQLGRDHHLYLSLGGGFRLPSFTELYYSSPANQGSRDLAPERSWTTELGYQWRRARVEMSVAAFSRHSRNLIDWTRAKDDDPWQVRNIRRLDTVGFELDTSLRLTRSDGPAGARLHMGYSHLKSAQGVIELASKYALTHLRNQLVIGLDHRWPGSGLRQDWRVRIEERVDRQRYRIVDTRLSWARGRMRFYIEANNLFDEDYVDPDPLPAPGRWLGAGMTLDLGSSPRESPVTK